MAWPRKFAERVGILCALMLALGACGGSGTTSSNAAVDAETAAAAPAESPPVLLAGAFDTLGGESIDLGSLEGQDVVFWFWAPW